MPEHLALTANLVTAAHADPTEMLDPMAPPATRDQPEHQERSPLVTLEHLDLQDHPDDPDQADPADHPDQPERTATPAALANLEPPETAVHPAKVEPMEAMENLATRDPRDRATTAHQHVSLQDIKIMSSTCCSSTKWLHTLSIFISQKPFLSLFRFYMKSGIDTRKFY